MPIYKYKAFNAQGSIIKGKLPAQNEMELESKLRQSSLDLVSASVSRNYNLFGLLGGVSLREMVLICIHFYQLERAGVPLLDSVGELRDISSNEIVREVMMDVYDSLKNGKTFSAALEAHPEIFDKVFVGLVKAGEKTGGFLETFKHLEAHYRWVIDIRKKIQKATTYPAVVLTMMVLVISLMMVFVVPKLSAFLMMQKIELPLYTVALIKMSDVVVKYWQLVVGIPVGIIFFAMISAKFSSMAQFYLHRFYLALPIMGGVMRKIEISRFCHFFAITYRSGIPILDCLEVSASVINNMVVKAAVMQVHAEVMDGRRLTDAVAQTGQFPALVVRMFKVGEESGNLDQSLRNISEFFDDEVNASIDNLVEFLEPALTVIMGGLLMWVTIAVFGPIYTHMGDIGRFK